MIQHPNVHSLLNVVLNPHCVDLLLVRIKEILEAAHGRMKAGQLPLPSHQECYTRVAAYTAHSQILGRA